MAGVMAATAAGNKMKGERNRKVSWFSSRYYKCKGLTVVLSDRKGRGNFKEGDGGREGIH